jgi:hypothetical protein
MKTSVIVWDLGTVPDLGEFAAANDAGKSDVEVREAIGDKFPKPDQLTFALRETRPFYVRFMDASWFPAARFPWRRRLFDGVKVDGAIGQIHRLGFRASRLGMPHGTKISLATDAEAPGVGPPEMT